MQQNYFELFQLPVSFDVNAENLASRHRAIIARVHPDQFAHKSVMEQRVALQWATFANEAFDTLKSPIARAQYLLKLNAPELAQEGVRVSLPPEFLMQQMQWREALEEGEVETVREEVSQLQELTLTQLADECAGQTDGSTRWPHRRDTHRDDTGLRWCGRSLRHPRRGSRGSGEGRRCSAR